MTTLPADIRVNMNVPFPATVQGQGIVAVQKSGGIWTVTLAPQLLGVQNPAANPLNDLAIVYDPIAKQLVLVPISSFGSGGAPAQRSIVGAGNLPLVANDRILNINAATDLGIILPTAVSRAGVALTFKALKTSHAQTINVTGADTIDGNLYVELGPTGSVTLVPFNDGVNSGWGAE